MSMQDEQELCQAFSDVLLDVQDVDEHDVDLPQLCSQYVKDIYNYLHTLEVIFVFSSHQNSLLCLGFYFELAVFVSTGGAGCTAKIHAGL